MKTIKFDIAKREQLRRAYKAAVLQEKETFVFEGSELLVSYAKYLIEHLDNTLGHATDQ